MFLQQIVNGLTIGAIWALVALGYTMVYGIIRLMNFAHGDIYMLSAFLSLTMLTSSSLPVWVALLTAIIATSIISVLIAFIGYRPLFHKSKISLWLVAVGMSIFLQNISIVIWGARTRPFPLSINKRIYNWRSVTVSDLQIIILLVAGIFMFLLHLFVRYTRSGRAMRAISQDLNAAKLMGMRVNRIVYITFAIGAALAAVGGIMVGLYYNAVYPMMGYRAGLIAFCAAVVGGVGSIPGAMLGGIIVGLAEALGAAYIGSGWRDGVAFIILIIVLVLRPQGLLNKRRFEKI